MGELGSIFDDVPDTAAGSDKGPDVRVRAMVRRSELEAGASVLVPVPDAVPYADGTVPRRREADDPPGAVRLHLSPRLTDGATLRLRRQGGEHPTSGVPGDLHVEIAIAPEPEPEPRRGPLVVAVVLTAITGAAVWLSHGIWWG
jgi:hypothetical protein